MTLARRRGRSRQRRRVIVGPIGRDDWLFMITTVLVATLLGIGCLAVFFALLF